MLGTIGKMGGCLFLILTICKIICKLTEIYHLYVTRNTSLRFAVTTSLYRQRGVNELLLSNIRDQRFELSDQEK